MRRGELRGQGEWSLEDKARGAKKTRREELRKRGERS